MKRLLIAGGILVCVLALVLLVVSYSRAIIIGGDPGATKTNASSSSNLPPAPAVLNTSTYNAKLLEIANLPVITKVQHISSTLSGTSSTIVYKTVTVTSTAPSPWPVKTVYPEAGALLPFNRIVAYYGNFYSTQMGILGEYPPPQVLAMLASTTAAWAAADPSTPVIPALDYIAVAAQSSPGPDGDYRLRMPASQIDKTISMANSINGIVILDVQIGLSTVQQEIPLLEQYLKLPNVNLAIDPEFAMHNGERPGTVVGTLDATDINFAANFLANLVQEYNLPPKILIIHRWTQAMVTNYQEITPLPQVQIVMDMDGFGSPAEKLSTYKNFISTQPVQFTGFKLFYKNDVNIGGHLMTPSEVLKLTPQPIFIQYQ